MRVTAVVAVTGGDGPSNLTPVWFDDEDDVVPLKDDPEEARA